MENFIYILIGIAWVAYSLYSARQKAIQKQQSSGLPPRGPSQSSPLPIPGNQGGGKSLLDDILREFSGDSRPVPQVVDKPLIPKQQKIVPESGPKNEVSSRYKLITDGPSDLLMNESEHDWEKQEHPGQMRKGDGASKRFDLREAVIYSELLNPKYF